MNPEEGAFTHMGACAYRHLDIEGWFQIYTGTQAGSYPLKRRTW